MNNNLIFIEGLPGSGKTTFAKCLNDYLISLNYQTKSLQEGDPHPLDVSWCGVFTKNEYDALLKKYLTYEHEIKKNTLQVNDMYQLAYTKIKVDKKDSDFYSDLEKKEIYNIHDLNHFTQYHKALYQTFNDSFDKETLYIFECVFLQNHINEHILKYGTSQVEINAYFNQLIKLLKNLNPIVIYLEQKDPDKTLTRMIKERVSRNPNDKDWIEHVVDYFDAQVHAKLKGYNSIEGVYQFVKDRLEKEKQVIKNLKTPTLTYEIDTNYDEVFEELKRDIVEVLNK